MTTAAAMTTAMKMVTGLLYPKNNYILYSLAISAI